MKKFVKHILFFLGIPAFVFIFFIYIKWNNFNDLIKADKVRLVFNKDRLNEIRKIENKIILIGGSNILFGIDKYLLEKITQRPVINLAHLRTDGTENMVYLANQVYNKNDIVLVSIEYGQYCKGGSGRLLDYYLRESSFNLIDFFLKDYIFGKDFENPFYSKNEETTRKSVYNSFNLDLFLVKLKNQNYRKLDTYQGQGYIFNYSEIDKDVFSQCKNRLNIYAFHPPLVKQVLSSSNKRKMKIGNIDSLPIRYITKQNNYIFDSIYIFDYKYHLNSSGRKIRTIKLAEDINKLLANRNMN